MCISGFGGGSKSSTPVKSVATDEKKKKKSLLENQGGRDNNRVSPTRSVSTGTQGRSGRDSFGNMEGRSRNRGDGMRSGY